MSTASTDRHVEGAWVRQQSAFRRWVDALEPGRYHLYVALACPWAHRTLIVRRLKGLEDAVGVSCVDPVRDERGWAFTGGRYTDPVNGFAFLAEAYEATQPGFDRRVSVPVLWDKREGTIVNNESSEIIRMLNALSDEGPDLYPEPLRAEIDALNDRIYATVNDGVYRAGFARSQEAYEQAVRALFATLAELDERLARRRWLVGDDDAEPTEADWRLFTTLVRFDAVYHLHFKCNLRRLVDLPHLWAYARELYQRPGIAETVDFGEIKRHYYLTHPQLDPSGIVPLGPEVDWDEPPHR